MELNLVTREKPDNLVSSHKVIDELHDLVERSQKQHKVEIDFLREKLRYLANLLYAAKSDNVAVSLFNEAELMAEMAANAAAGEAPAGPDPVKPTGKGKPKPRKIIPDGLPVERKEHDLTEAEKVGLHRIGEEITRELDYTPGKFRVIEHVTFKYGSRADDTVIRQSQRPATLLPKAVVSPALLSHIIISKYENHLPLYRQQQMFSRHGVHLTRDVMANWVIRFGNAVVPLINLLKDEQIASSSLQCDETPYRVLTVDGVKVSKKSYIWVTCRWSGRPIILYQHGPGRGANIAKEILADFRGYLQVDGYSGYNWVENASAGIVRVGCLAHVRRKFTDFLKILPQASRTGHAASHIVRLIKVLYEVEEKLRLDRSLDRRAVRQEQARPQFDLLTAKINDELGRVALGGEYGKALIYAADELPLIRHYLDSAEVEIDNNLCENSLRPFCLGKKNWLFAATNAGAEASANIYSLIMTARANGRNAEAYLADLIEKLPACKTADDYSKLLPF